MVFIVISIPRRYYSFIFKFILRDINPTFSEVYCTWNNEFLLLTRPISLKGNASILILHRLSVYSQRSRKLPLLLNSVYNLRIHVYKLYCGVRIKFDCFRNFLLRMYKRHTSEIILKLLQSLEVINSIIKADRLDDR